MRLSALLLAALLLPAPPAAAQQAPAQVDPQAAASAFGRGTELFDKQDYVGAIESFQQAYQLRPHFLVLCNIALSYERLGDMVRSAAQYSRCLNEGGDKSQDAESVKNTLRNVEERISWATVKSEQGGTVYLDGRAIGAAPQRVPMNPGGHVLEVRKPGSRPASASITARRGEEQTLQLEPEPLPSKPPQVVERTVVQPATAKKLNQVWFWSSAGLTAAFTVAATVLGIQTLGLHSDYEQSPTQDLLDSGRTRSKLTTAFLAAAVVAAGATTTLFFFTDFEKERAPAQPARAATYGLGLRGSF